MTHRPGKDEASLLKALQEDFRPTERPFSDIAEKLGWTEEEVIERTRELMETGLIRKLGAIIAPRNIGYVSTLAAMDLPEDEIEEHVGTINAFSGVTHNYLREGHPNIWFTMTERDQQTLDENLRVIEEKTGIGIIRMPVTKMYRIGVKLDV